MRDRIKAFIKKYRMLQPKDQVLAAVSGGADSVCLLLLLSELRRELDFHLEAVHVEHGIRGEESLRDAAFVGELCRELGVDLLSISVDAPRYAEEKKLSLEEAARELRYRAFEDACKRTGASRVAVAHHADDNAETMLFHLSRGTDLNGLAGISPVREGTGYTVIRPLLCVTREEILRELERRRQTWCTDSTNQDPSMTRNYIRQQVLPGLREVNAQAVQHMERTAELLRQLSSFVDASAREAEDELLTGVYEDGALRQLHLEAAGFLRLHPVLQKNILHRSLGRISGSKRDLTTRHVEAVQSLFAQETGRRLTLPNGVIAEKRYDCVILRHADAAPQQETCGEELTLPIPGTLLLPDGSKLQADLLTEDARPKKIPEKIYTKWLDYDKISSTVCVRNRRPGDFLQIDARGGHKKLKDYLIDEKVPREERDRLLLLADGSHVLWVFGYRISEAVKVTEKTERILRICIKRRTTP